jgi:hypothetical protein
MAVSTVETKPKISAVEMERRREAVRQADADNRIEGQFSGPESAEVFEAFIRGDIDLTEILQRLHVLHRHP